MRENLAGNRVGARMAAIAGLALVVGLAFNAANPLGVHGTINAAKATTSPSAVTPATGATRVYENETLSFSLETGAAPAAANPVPAANPTAANGPAANPVPTVPTLTWPETSKLLAAGQIVLVDARAAVYYQTEHVPGAVSLPAGSPPAELAAFAAKYPKDTALVVHCGSLQCPLSNQLVAVLTGQLGYKNVRVMPGGFAEYRQFQSQVAKGGGAQ